MKWINIKEGYISEIEGSTTKPGWMSWKSWLMSWSSGAQNQQWIEEAEQAMYAQFFGSLGVIAAMIFTAAGSAYGTAKSGFYLFIQITFVKYRNWYCLYVLWDWIFWWKQSF
jgi:hypothetical protein